MAITEISVADSITRGYYYVVGRICTRAVCARLYAFDAFVEIKGKSADFAMPLMGDQLEFYDADSKKTHITQTRE